MFQFSKFQTNGRRNWCVFTFAAVTILLFLGGGQVARAADGDLDPTFGIGGKVVTDFTNSTDWLSRIAVQPDGKIVAIGDTHPSHKGALARYNPDGTLDATFGNGGKVIIVATVRESANGLLILPDGKIMISGSISLPSEFDSSFALLRFNSDGSVDPTFGNGGTVMTNIAEADDYAYAIARQSDGKIVAAGRRGIQFNPTEQRKGHVALARYNPDGSLDATFGNGGTVENNFGQDSWDHGRDAVLQADGKIILVGIAEINTPYDSFAVARFNPDGSLDQSFGNGGKVVMINQGDLEAGVLQSDGKLIALGDNSASFKLLRFNLDGSLDSTFGSGGIVTTAFGGSAAAGSDLVFQADGKLLAGGLTSSDIYFNNSDFALARYLDSSGPPPTPTPTPTATPPATSTPTPPAATPTPTPQPTTSPGATPTPTPAPTATPEATATPTPEATATPGAAVQPLNISTRLHVETGENVAIGGFIIAGNSPKKVAIRGLGPSLQIAGFSNTLLDPTLELRGPANSFIASNDNWRDNANWAGELAGVGLAPEGDLESAIVATLPPGGYTAIMRGKNGSTGMGLVEVYDLDRTSDSLLANISTRGLVRTGDDVVIGGFILGGNGGQTGVLVRAIGPSLANAGISDALANPTLELRDANGLLLQENDNWKDRQQAVIEATGIPPQNDLESAILATLPPGSYTAIAAGNGGSVGVGLIEVYDLR